MVVVEKLTVEVEALVQNAMDNLEKAQRQIKSFSEEGTELMKGFGLATKLSLVGATVAITAMWREFLLKSPVIESALMNLSISWENFGYTAFEAIDPLVEPITDVFSGIIDRKTDVQQGINDIADAFTQFYGLPDEIRTAMKLGGLAINDELMKWSYYFEYGLKIYNWIKPAFDSAYNAIVTWTGDAYGAIAGWTGDVSNAISIWSTDAYSSIFTWTKDVERTFRNFTKNTGTVLSDWWTNTANWFSSRLTEAQNWLNNILGIESRTTTTAQNVQNITTTTTNVVNNIVTPLITPQQGGGYTVIDPRTGMGYSTTNPQELLRSLGSYGGKAINPFAR